jgi:hypothetical protein
MAIYPNTDFQELVDRPRESLDIEIKSWLDLNDANQRADLAKAIIAIANHGGGFIVIGFSEGDAGNFTTDPNRPPNLNGLSQDAVQDAVQKYLEPPVQCRVSHISHADGHGQFPVIAIPGGHRTPIKARAGSPDGKLIATRVYIRRPGPRSEEPQSSAEWDHLFERCIRARSTELLDSIRDVLAGVSPQTPLQPDLSARLQSFTEEAQARWNKRVSDLPINAAPRFPKGYYEASFAIDGAFEHHDLRHFRDVFQTALKNHSGWPPFPYGSKFVAITQLRAGLGRLKAVNTMFPRITISGEPRPMVFFTPVADITKTADTISLNLARRSTSRRPRGGLVNFFSRCPMSPLL